MAGQEFYTYAHYRANETTPFYIGKGSGQRAYATSGRSEYWNRVVKKHGLRVEILAWWDVESDAFEHERFLISCFRDMGVKLCNMTDGGDGTSGLVRSEEWKRSVAERMRVLKTGKKDSEATRKKKSESAKGRPMSPEAIAKTAAFHRGRKRSPETLAKMSAALKGKGLGKVVSEETREKLRSNATGRGHTEEVREVMRQKRKQYWIERKAKIEAAQNNPEELEKLKPKPFTEERKRKISEARKAYWAMKGLANLMNKE